MVAVVSGNGLGLFNTSRAAVGAVGSNGSSVVGPGHDQVFVNSTTGNLVIQSVDENLPSAGTDQQLVRTYNSQGRFDGDNDDNWRIGGYRTVQLNGSMNDPASTITKTFGDGAEVVYRFVSPGVYQSTDGEGAHDTISYDPGTSGWIWTEGSSLISETYDSQGRMVSERDAGNNVTTYQYLGSKLELIMGGGGYLRLTYTGDNLTKLYYQPSQSGEYGNSHYYEYDSLNRLTKVSLDYWAIDDSIADGGTFVSEYRYVGDTHLISEVLQHDGQSPTVLASQKFTYELNAGLYRVKTVTDGEGRVTTFNYSQANNPSGTSSIQVPAAPAQLHNTETHTEPRTFTLNGASLTTPVTGWGTAALLESAGGGIIEPKVAFDSNGNGFAVWVQGNDVLTRRYTRVNDTWAAAVTLDSNNNAPTSPTLAVDAAGNAVIAWSQSNGTAVSAYGNRYDVTTGTWGTATLLESTTQVVATTAYSMSAAIDGANAAVAFLQSDGTRNNLYVTRYSGGSWGAATLVEARTNVAAQPSLDIDGLGNIAVVFQQSDGTANSTYVNRYRVSNGTWAGASLLESSGTAIIEPKVMFDSSGNGFAVWAQGADIISRRYTRSTDTWAAAVTLETSANTASAPTLAMDAAGNAVVAWAQSNGSAVSAYANRFNVTAGTWTGAALLETTNQVVDATAYSISASINGTQAAVAFLQSDGTRNNVFVTRLNSGGTWGTATLVESRTNVAAQPIVTIDSLGNTAVVFQQSDGTANSIYVTRNVADARPYYVVPGGTNWQNVATAVYQNVTSPNAGAVLAAQLTGQTLTAGNRLVGFAPTLTADVQITDNVAPYFIVTVADWVEITNTLYGTRDPNAVLALKGATGEPALSVNLHLPVPTTLTYSPQGSVTIPAGNPAVSTAGTVTTTQHPGLIAGAPTNAASMGLSAIDAFENQAANVIGGPLIARNASGNGFAIWAEGGVIHARRYTATSQTWSADTVIATGTSSTYPSDLKIDAAGNAIVVWTNWNATLDLHALSFNAASGTWSDSLIASAISYGVGYGNSISASIAAGRAAVTYIVKEGGIDRLHVARYNAGTWSTGAAVDSSSSDIGRGIGVIDSAGNITVAWEQPAPNSNIHAYTSRWDAATSAWSTPQLLNENTYVYFSGNTQLSVDAAGNVFALYNLSYASIVRRYDIATHSWQAPATISIAPSGGYPPKLAVDGAGNAIVAYLVAGTDTQYVFVRRYSAATQSWREPELVASTGTPEWPTSQSYAIRSVEFAGRFAAVSWDGAGGVHFARFADGQWTEEPTVVTNYAVSSLDSGGNQEFLYVGPDAGGVQSVFHKRFSSPYLTIPPSANWQALANTLYGINSVAAGNALRDALGNPPLTSGNRLEGLPQSLAFDTTTAATVAPYYTVQAGDTWQTVAMAVYGQTSVAIAAALRRAVGEPALIAGHTITVPATLYFGADLTFLSTDVVDALGNTSTYVVDAQGRLTTTRSPLVDGQRIELAYGYDAEGNVTSITQDVGGLNRVTNFYYDSHGNLQRSRDSLGNTVVRGYDAANQVITETHYTGTDPDAAGPQDPAGAQTTHYVYDSYLHLLRFEISPQGRVTEYRYTGFWGRQLESKRVYTAGQYSGSDFSDGALGTWASQQDLTKLELTKYQFSFAGQIGIETRYAATDANGNGLSAGQSQTTYMYNGRGVEIYKAGPVGSAFLGVTQAMTSGGYDALNRAGSVSQSIDSNWARLEIIYDDIGHVQRVRDTFNSLNYPADSYNFMNRVGEITRSQRVREVVNNVPTYDTTNYAYDAGGRLRMVTDPAGIRSYSIYDSLGRKVGDIDAAGRLTRQVYNHANELVATIRYSSLLSATALASLVDAQGKPANVDINDLVASLASVPGRDASKDQVTRNVFDAAGRLVYTIDPTGAVSKTNYDGTGRVTGLVAYATRVSIPDSITQVTIAQLETVGSAYKVSVDVVLDRATRNIYDQDGLLVATLDGEGYLTEFEFDAGGRLLAKHSWATPTDPLLRATGTPDLLRPAADPHDIHVHHMYDGEGRDIAVIDGEGFLTENVYDDASNLAQVIRYGNSVTWTSIATLDSLRSAATGVNHVTSYRYDGLGRVVQETNYEGTVNTASYDGRGNLLTSTAASGTSDARTVSKRYDAMGHLIAELTAEGSAAIAGGTDYQTAWDQYATHYQYDSSGHRISSIDPQGNRTLYFYDVGGELRFALIDHGDGKGELTETRYDALGQQITRIAYSTLIDTASLTGGLVGSAILSRAAAAFDVVHDQVITLNYARNGQVEYSNTSNETATDADDARTTFHYNAFGEVTTQEERIDGASRLREHSYAFDRRGLQTSIAWEPGTVNQTQATEYDAFGRATRVTDQYNNVTRIEYDRLGRVVTTYDALNQSRSVSYDAFSRVFSSTDALQKTTNYSYNDAARSVTITTPELISVTTTHNREGQTLTITDSLGLRNGYEYDANGQLKRSYDALGNLETRFYDRAGRLTDSHDANNVVTHFAYDAANRVLTRTSDYGGLTLQTVFAYDGQGRVTRVTEPGGHITDTSYYGDGRVRDVTVDPDGLHIVTHYDYDLTGNAIKVTEDASGAKPRITQYKYDDLGRRTDQIVDPTEFVGATGLNLHTQYRYDRNGNLTHKIDGEGHSTWYVFDQNNRLTETIDALGGVTSVSYGAEGRVIETRRHASKVETSGFQDIVAAQGLAPTVRDRITRSFYDADGRERFTVATSSAQDNGGTIVERGLVTERTFDVQGKVTQVRIHRSDIAIPVNADTADIAGLVSTHPEDRVVSTLYDLRGRAVFNIDVYRSISRNWYDASGRLVRTTTYAAAPDGSVNLDVAGLTTWSDAREGNVTDQTRRFWYDAIGRVRYAVDGEGYLKETQYLDATREVVEYAYANKPSGLNPAPSVLADSAHDKKTTTLRDAAGRVSKVTQVVDYQFDGIPTPGSLFEQYTYDGVGNKRSYRNANGDVWTYDYDASGRLSAEFSPELWVTTVDASGNNLVRHPEFVSVVTRITYDDIGNVITRTEGIRRNVAAGTESSDGTRTTTYGYDLLGRQTSVTHPQVMVYTAPANDAQNTDINDQVKEIQVTPTSTTTYNTLGDAITNQDVNGAISRKAYDELGRLRFDVDALGYVTEYTFDNFGNVTELTRHAVALSPSAIANEWTAAAIDTAVGYNNSDRTIVTEYDRLNRRTRVTQPAFISYTPDAVGLLPGIYVQAIGETRYEYDAFGQLTRERKLLDQERGVYADTWFLYDNNGQRRYTVDDLHYVTEERFDAFGRVTFHDEYVKSISGSAPWTLASVQAAIQPTLSGAAHPNGLDRKTTFEYDSLGRMRLQQVFDVEFKTGNGSSTGSDFGTQQTKYEYDAVGNRTTITDHYNAVTWTFYDALGRVRAVVEPPRAVDTDGDFFVETGVQPLTEMNRNAYGDIVEQIRYASGALGVSANGYTAPGGASLTNRLLLDVYGHVKRSQDGTLAPDGSLATKYFSYNVRGDVAKEWQVFTDADNRKYVQSVIHQYDALGRETMTIQPQVRSDMVPVAPTTFQVVKAAGFMYQPGGGQWIYDNEVSANFTPANVPGQVWVYLDYTRTNPNGPPNDPHHQSTYVSGSAGHATFAWTDTNTQPPAFPANGGIESVERVRVYGQDAQGFYTVLLRDSDGNPPGAVTGNSQVAYAQTRYNGFGEITERGVNAAPVDANTALQEYWSYDDAGHVWRSNADGGVDKVYLYDVASRVTAEIRNQRVDFIRDLTGAEGAYYASDRMMTETMYDSLHHITAQRTPTFDIDERLDPATTSVSISLVNGRPFLQWVGTLDPSIKTDFKYSFNNLDWVTLQVVALPNGMLGVDVTDLARVNLVVLNFQIVKSLSLQFAPFAVSSGTFHVKLGETVTFGIQSTDNPRVATPVIGPGPAIGPTSFTIERRAPWYQSGPTGQWIYDNKVNAFWDPTGLTGNVRVYLFYTRELAGGNAIGDTETRSLDVSGASGYADFTWTDINRFPPDNPVNGGIWSVQKIEVYGQNAQGQYTVLLRGPNGSPPGPPRLRWTAPPAQLFVNPVFYYKRSDSSTWSVGLTPTASNGQLEVDINSLLVDHTIYDYRIEYWQQNTGILLARKEGQIDATTTSTLLSANDVYPTAIYLANPYQVGGVYSNFLRWDANPDLGDIVEFKVNGVLVDTLSTDKHQIDLSGISGLINYELTFRHSNQSQAYARNAGTMNIGRATAYPETVAGLNQVPVQPRSTPYVQLTVDRWGNVLQQAEGAVWNALNDSGVMQRSDIVRLRTQYAYNVFGQLTTTTNEDVSLLDTRGSLDPEIAIPTHYDDVTTANYYDMLGRQVATRDENGNFNGVTLNLAGQVTGELHADGGTKSYMYDAYGRQIQVQDEIGWRVRTSYDAANRQTGVQTEWAPELWLTREFTYDEIGRRIAETSGAAAVAGGEETTRYFYDLAGNLIRRRSALGATTTYTYDVDGHETSERNAIGALTRFESDHFGNLQHKWDLSDERTDYYYNGAGLLDWTTSTRASLLPFQMDYEYDGAGHLTAVIDNVTNRRADYGFDTYGRLRRERTVVDGVTHQDTQTSYDAMNRISKIVDLRYSLQYYYDAHSNRTLVVSNYLDHVHALHTDNLWYTYDEMNRVEFSEGNRRHDEEGWHEIALTSDRGTYSEYQQNGQRAFTDQYGKGVLHFNGAYSYVDGYYREAYEYDGAGRLHALWHSTTTNGNDRVEVREYDGASRLIRSEQRRVNQSNTHFFYDDDGQMYQQVVRQTISDEGAITSKTDFNNDAAGVQRGYLTTVYNPNGTRKEEYSYGNHYRLADGYLLDRQDVQLTKYNSNGNNPNNFYGTIERIYDVNNNVVKMYDSNGAADRKYRYLANNLQGEVMTAIEGDFANDTAVRQGMKTAVEGNANLNYAQHFFHTHGASVGSLGQLDGTVDGQPNPTAGKKARFFGIAAWGDSWAGGAARRPIPLSGRMPDGSMWQPPKPPSMNANFDANFTEIGSFQASATNVVVQQGDTLRSIATRLFGDGALWYLLADENGLADPDTALQAGSNLRVPTQVYALANTAHIYKPFDSSAALNGKQPTLIDPTPPPPKQPCGGHAKLILTIIAVVVTAIVAYFMGPASGPVAAFFQGMIAAVAGNAVSQGVAIGMGLQDGFNWKQAALAGVSGGIGGAIAPAVGQFLPNSPIAAGFVSGAIGNTITQGASIALGLQKSFSWKDVAMSAVSGAANATIAKYAPSAFNQPQSFLGDFGKSLVTGATGSVVQAAFGGKIDGLDIAANAFGTALGNSIVRGLQGAPKLGVGSKQDKPKDEGAEDELAEVVVTAQRRGAGLSGNPQGGSIVGLGDDPFADDGMMPSVISPDELEMEFDHDEILASLGSSMPNIEESVVAKSGDSISRILGTSDPAAIGAFMRANGLTSSTIRAGDEYVIPNGAPTVEDQAAGQSVLNHDEQRRADRAVAQAARAAANSADTQSIPSLLMRPVSGDAPAQTDSFSVNMFGQALLSGRDANIRGAYSSQIAKMSDAAVERIKQLGPQNLDAATAESKAASVARDDMRKAAQKQLSPGGKLMSEAMESKLTPDQRLAKKIAQEGGNVFEGAKANAASAGHTNPDVSKVNKVLKFAGPVGRVVEFGRGVYEVYKAPQGQKLATGSRVVGEAAGGALGYMAGTAAVGAAALGLAAVGVAVAPIAVLVVGAIAGIAGAMYLSNKVGGWAESGYRWLTGS